jgi:hypothetical protein
MRAAHAQTYSLRSTSRVEFTRHLEGGKAPSRSVDGVILPRGLAPGLEASEWRSRRQGLFRHCGTWYGKRSGRQHKQRDDGDETKRVQL